MFKSLTAGVNVPNDIHVIIEIPAYSEPVKYEVNKETGVLHVDRFMNTSMRYPCNYGYIPNTLGEDNDPIDVLVISPLPLLSGTVIRLRPIGLLKMKDEAGHDSKILAVPIDKLTPLYHAVHQPSDLHSMILDQIQHFFQHYKDLEEGKWAEVEGWEGPEHAKQEIMNGIKRYQESKEFQD